MFPLGLFLHLMKMRICDFTSGAFSLFRGLISSPIMEWSELVNVLSFVLKQYFNQLSEIPNPGVGKILQDSVKSLMCSLWDINEASLVHIATQF